MMHHGDVRHAGDRIESGERIQLVAFFYGSEKRGQALPLASPKSSPFDVPLSISTPPTSDEIIAASWPKGAPRDPQGKPLSLSSSYSSNSSAASTASASSASSAASAATAATAATAAAVASFNSHQSQLLQLSQATGQRAVGLIERAMLEAQRDITLAEVAKLAQA
jgi:fructose-1,6-bisphosphatase/inositol monophosphatase family enzyme